MTSFNLVINSRIQQASFMLPMNVDAFRCFSQLQLHTKPLHQLIYHSNMKLWLVCSKNGGCERH